MFMTLVGLMTPRTPALFVSSVVPGRASFQMPAMCSATRRPGIDLHFVRNHMLIS
jgi:hypothetical protein